MRSFPKPTRYVGLGVVVGALIAATVIGPASASADPAPPTPTGWVYFPAGVSLQNAKTYVTTAGDRDAAGKCNAVVSHAEGKRSGAGTHVIIETGFDAATCQSQYTEGLETHTTSVPASDTSSGSDSGSQGASTGQIVDPTAYQDNQWLDPFGIQVNAQEQWLDWTISGGCNNTYSNKWKYSWYGVDGWAKNYDHAATYFDCAIDEAENNSKFSNDAFCGTVDTHTYFGYDGSNTRYDTLSGWWDASYSWTYNDYKSGGCTDLLHHGHKDHT